jgi:hypothetical protein
MPVPVLVWGAAALLAALLGGGALWIYASAKGKSVVLLGVRRSGKSTLFTFLQTGEIPIGYKPTTIPRTFEETVRFKDLELKLQATDVSGDKSAWKVWREEATAADLVCFLTAWTDVDDRRGWDRVSRAARQVGSWGLEARTVLVVTFADKAPVSYDAIKADARVRELGRFLGATDTLVADQTNEHDRLDLGASLLEMLK